MNVSRVEYWLSRAGNVIAMLAILLLLALIAFGASKLFGPLAEGEIQIGVVVVFAIVALLAMASITAAIFSGLNLASAQNALGLPEGSVRALIALFLIMIFILMSVYLFRAVSGHSGAVLQGISASQVAALQEQLANVTQNNDNTFDVTLRADIPAAAEQMALQLITILGTLVTAVSAFYFGSATTASKSNVPASAEAEAAKSAAAKPPPGTRVGIHRVMPATVDATAASATSELTIAGSGFAPGAQVKLTNGKGAELVPLQTTVVSASQITCTFDLRGAPIGKWTLAVVNPDGSAASKDEIFEITKL